MAVVNKQLPDELTEGVNIAEKSYYCRFIYSELMDRVVSFMHLPAHITDTEVKLKLANYGIDLKG